MLIELFSEIKEIVTQSGTMTYYYVYTFAVACDGTKETVDIKLCIDDCDCRFHFSEPRARKYFVSINKSFRDIFFKTLHAKLRGECLPKRHKV